MDDIPRNPLSCTRCKAKKIKCGREEPRCDKCTASKAECFYPSRRQKTRNAKKRANILSEILQRLDALERKVGAPHRSVRDTDTRTSFAGDNSSTIEDDENDTETEGAHTENEAPFTSLCQLMDEAADTTRNILGDEPEPAPQDPEADVLFSEALTSLRSFRWKGSQEKDTSDKLDIPRDLAQKWVNACFQFTFFEQMIGVSNKSLMMAMPDIMKSPVVQVNYGVIVVYYNLLFCGWRMDENSLSPQNRDYGRKIYYECLKLFPAWKNDGVPSNTMDFIGTGFMSLIAIENFDYKLGWELHLACCSIARDLKLDKLDDVDPENRPTEYEDEIEKNSMRKRVWQLIHMEFFFRLYYDKPPSMTASDFSVNLPSIQSGEVAKHKSDTVYFLFSSRMMFILKEFFDLQNKPGETARHEVEQLEIQIENLMDEWKLTDMLADHNEELFGRWMYADLLINAYMTVILMERKVDGRAKKTKSPSPRSVDAARKTLDTMQFLSSLFGQGSPTFTNFVSFYPFVAFFTLYHHILFTIQQRKKTGKLQAEEIEADIVRMENLTKLLRDLDPTQEEFRLISNAFGVLNKASRHLLSTSQPPTPISALQTPTGSHNLRDHPSIDMNKPTVASNPPIDPSLIWTDTDGSNWSQLEGGLQQYGLKTPFLYAETIESDLFGKNWHQSWWEQ